MKQAADFDPAESRVDFDKNFGRASLISMFTGDALAFLLIGKGAIDSQDKRGLEGAANRAHAERSKICGRILKDFGNDPNMSDLIPLLKLGRMSAAAAARSQNWVPNSMGPEMKKVGEKLLPLYTQVKSKYPTASHLLQDVD